jgi:hypothetical protein
MEAKARNEPVGSCTAVVRAKGEVYATAHPHPLTGLF